MVSGGSKSLNNPEVIREVEHAWLFDVDGVITNPEQKRVTEPKILDEIAKRLEKGEPVALVTGRSIDFMKDRVISPLKKKIADPNLLQNFLAMGEKGGVWITYENGQPQEHIDDHISVPQDLKDQVRGLIEEEFSDLMFYDETKKTMISTEMKDNTSVENYHKRQTELNRKLEELVVSHGLQSKLEVDPTTIATDIQDKNVGKDFAARRVLDWLKQRNIKPQNFITVGDSRSDLPMAQEIHSQGLAVTFVFVGKEVDRDYIREQSLPFPVSFPQNTYEKGTLEFLSQTS